MRRPVRRAGGFWIFKNRRRQGARFGGLLAVVFVVQTLFGDAFVFFGAQFVGERGAHEVEVGLNRGACAFGVAVLQSGVDRAVLVEEGGAGGAQFKNDLPVVEHAGLQKVIHRAHHVQEDDVVAGLDDGEVEVGVEAGFGFCVALFVGGFHFLENRIHDGEVGVGGKARSAVGGEAFHVAAEVDGIKDRFGVA